MNDRLSNLMQHVARLTLAHDAQGAALADPADLTRLQAEATHYGLGVAWVHVERIDWPMLEPRPAMAWLGLLEVGIA